LVSYVIDRKQGVSIAKEYDKQLFSNAFEMSPNPTHYGKFCFCGKHIIDEDSNLDIFKMYIGTGEPTTELMNRVLQMFKRY
jgi:hypothetical protein